MKILIAEDDRATSAALAGRLRQGGHQTIVAFDAMQVSMMAMRELPDAVILDINMPAGSGIQALQRLKASSKTAHIPVIVLTGSPDPDLPRKVEELGGAAYLTKPVDFDKLEEALKGLAAN